MKKITLLVLLLVSSIAFSQKCKYITNEVDEFTGDKITLTKSKVLTYSGGLANSTTTEISGMKVNDNYYLKLKIYSPRTYTVIEDNDFMLKDINGNIHKLKFSNSKISKVSGTYGSKLRFIGLHDITLTKADFELLKNIEIVKVRWYTAEDHVSYDVSKKRRGNISLVLKCLD